MRFQSGKQLQTCGSCADNPVSSRAVIFMMWWARHDQDICCTLEWIPARSCRVSLPALRKDHRAQSRADPSAVGLSPSLHLLRL
eukprot:55974-Eustigmatos_ZCMA.PRE.1